MNTLVRMLKIRGLAILALCLVWCLPSIALADLIRVETDTNLKAVYLIEDTVSDIIKVSIMFEAGEVDAEGPEGLSHYLEHLMFWHADQAGGNTIHGRGGNAWVNGIHTVYFTSGNASEIDDLFEFAGRLLDLPDLNKKFMLEEKKVVEREYDLRVSENPDRQLWAGMRRLNYGHSYLGRSTIGTPESIRSLTLEQAFAFHKKYYNPTNMILLITGNLDEENVRNQVEQVFKGNPTGQINPQLWRDGGPVERLDQRTKLTTKNVRSISFKAASLSKWSGSGDRLNDLYTVLILEKLLNSALDGSLSKPLRLDEFVARSLGSYLNPVVNGQIEFSVYGVPDEGVSLSKVELAFTNAIQKIAKNGIPKASIERVRSRLIKLAERKADDAEFILKRAFSLLRLGENPIGASEHIMRLKAVSKSEVDALMRAIANPERTVVGNLIKENQ